MSGAESDPQPRGPRCPQPTWFAELTFADTASPPAEGDILKDESAVTHGAGPEDGPAAPKAPSFTRQQELADVAIQLS